MPERKTRVLHKSKRSHALFGSSFKSSMHILFKAILYTQIKESNVISVSNMLSKPLKEKLVRYISHMKSRGVELVIFPSNQYSYIKITFQTI